MPSTLYHKWRLLAVYQQQLSSILNIILKYRVTFVISSASTRQTNLLHFTSLKSILDINAHNVNKQYRAVLAANLLQLNTNYSNRVKRSTSSGQCLPRLWQWSSQRRSVLGKMEFSLPSSPLSYWRIFFTSSCLSCCLTSPDGTWPLSAVCCSMPSTAFNPHYPHQK